MWRKTVYISSQRKWPGKDRKHCTNLNPYLCHSNGKMRQLEKSHAFTKHVLEEGHGMLILKGMSHSVRSLKNTVALVMCVDGHLKSQVSSNLCLEFVGGTA